MKLWKKVIVGLVLGVIFGLSFKEYTIYIKPLGDIFIRLIKMVIVPLIFFAIVGGITSVQDSKILGRIGIKASFAYILTTLFAITIGISTGIFFKPGQGTNLNFNTTYHSNISSDTTFNKIAETLLKIIPENAIDAMAQGTVLQVVFFALFTGITLNTLDKESSRRLGDMFKLLSAMVFRMVHYIIMLSPVAAFALTAWVIGTQGIGVLQSLLKLIVCAYAAFGLQYLVFGLIIFVWTRLSPKPFFKKSIEYQTIAFSTSSSKAALPTTINVCKKKMGVSDISSSFVLPLGASINMDGIAIYISLCTIFFAQALGRELGWSDYGFIMLTGTLGSIGGAGIPGGTIVMLPMVLGSVGLPIEGVALIAGIDRIIDMMRTTVSITGDATIALCVDYSEDLLDVEIYNK